MNLAFGLREDPTTALIFTPFFFEIIYCNF